MPEGLLLVIGEVEHEGVPEPEGRAQLGGQARVQVAAGQADLDPHHAGVPGALEQPGDAEPANAQPVGDVDLGHTLEIELPGHPRGQDNFGRPIRRQAGHVPSSPIGPLI